ncbi:MAG: VCBS repeat-containing protein [Myxococcales bacterium]|nr:VCBS repeat-containing protein [Myxococcales bacterium]
MKRVASYGLLCAQLALASCTTPPPPPTDGAMDSGVSTDSGASPDSAVVDVPNAPMDSTAPTDAGVATDARTPPADVMMLPAPSCMAATGGGAATSMAPTLLRTLSDRFHEGWLASPAVADLDRDGRNEIVIARAGKLLVYRPDGSIAWSFDVPSSGRIWASPVIVDLAGDANLEVAFAARGSVYVLDARGAMVPGFPYMWRDELRSIAAGDVDGDGRNELVVLTTNPLPSVMMSPRDIMLALEGNGTVVRGWPPNTTMTSGCDTNCFVTGGYDQNLAVGPIDNDASWDVFGAQDNAYLSWHRGSGVAFDANTMFRNRRKVLGVRFLHDLALAQQGYANDENTANQAHFTNTAPAIADIDGDGRNELVFVGSVQNAAQSDRLRGVALWVVNSDASRPALWSTPYHVPMYRAGLWDFDGTNIVGLTNQVTVADMDPMSAGLEMVFAGFDGGIHMVDARKTPRWRFEYTTSNDVLTTGVAVGDLSGDGVPEVVFATYSPRMDASALYVLSANGAMQHRIALPRRGAMSVPTLADVDGNGTIEIIVNLKDGEDRMRSALVYTVAGSHAGCLLWPTGRGNLLRNGYVPRR